jgi:hypothetical protein
MGSRPKHARVEEMRRHVERLAAATGIHFHTGRVKRTAKAYSTIREG